MFLLETEISYICIKWSNIRYIQLCNANYLVGFHLALKTADILLDMNTISYFKYWAFCITLYNIRILSSANRIIFYSLRLHGGVLELWFFLFILSHKYSFRLRLGDWQDHSSNWNSELYSLNQYEIALSQWLGISLDKQLQYYGHKWRHIITSDVEVSDGNFQYN